MLIPNKAIPLDESCLYKTTKILDVLTDDIDVIELYLKTKNKFNDLAEFMDTLDLLYLLGKVKLDYEKGIIQIA
jgi:hypothetical protein